MFWIDYQKTIFQNIDLHSAYEEKISHNETDLVSKTYSGDYVLKSMETYIDNGKSFIYDNIIYPKTGSNPPFTPLKHCGDAGVL